MKKIILIALFFLSSCSPAYALYCTGCAGQDYQYQLDGTGAFFWTCGTPTETRIPGKLIHSFTAGYYGQNVCQNVATGLFKDQLYNYPPYGGYLTELELQTLLANGEISYEFLVQFDHDEDGISDYSELMQEDGDYLDANIQPAGGELDPPPVDNSVDTDEDGITDNVEIRLGTDPQVATDMVSGDFTSTTIENFEPEDLFQAVVIQTYDAENDIYDYIVLDEFTLNALTPFGDADVYTLGDYGLIPDGVDVKLVDMIDEGDGVYSYDWDNGLLLEATEEGSYGDNEDFTTWETQDPDALDYTGGGFAVAEDNIDAVNDNDNSDTALDTWTSYITPFADSDFQTESSISADVQIDPQDIAEGIILAGLSVETSTLPGISEIADTELETEIDSTDGLLSDFGDTSFEAGDVLSNEPMNDAIGLLSWVDDLYSIPVIGQESEFTINGFIYNEREYPDFVIDFDYPIVSVFRVAFLFFFYLSTIWVFFRLTRYAWG